MAHALDGEGIGLVVGFSGERSWSFGWEASLTRPFPFAKASAGGVYHVAPKGEDPFTIHCAAWEPWLLVGGTLGVGVADGSDPARFAYGGWIGAPPLGLTRGDRIWALTFTVGIRVFGVTSQLYGAPKLWRFTPFEFHS